MAKRGEIFEFIQNVHRKRTKFNMSHDRILSVNMGELAPCFCQEVIPGSTWKLGATPFVRFAPLLAPIMSRVDIKCEFWFVPARLLWDEWENFITTRDSELAPAMPYFTPQQLFELGGDNRFLMSKNSLSNNLGIPALASDELDGNEVKISQLPFRAYQFIWNERYRDENLQYDFWHEDCIPSFSGNELSEQIFKLRRRAWKKDYFTSALPFAQKGEQVTIPVSGSTAPVVIDGNYGTIGQTGQALRFNTEVPMGSQESLTLNPDGSNHNVLWTESGLDVESLSFDDVAGMVADLDKAEMAITIRDLRNLSILQSFLEADARGGTRPKEMLYQHFGVISPDARLQQPEYLGGGSIPVSVSEVLQQATAQSGAEREQSRVGDMYGHGIAAGSFMGIKKHTFVEHGYIIGLVSVMPHASYSQGLPRMFSRMDSLDFAWPEFACIGEQEIKNKEIYLNGGDPEGTFGYQSRYSEYKYIPDYFSGDFTDNLAFWHLGRIFDNAPQLNEEFIECKPRNDIFAVTDSDVKHIWIAMYFNATAHLPLPKFGTPRLN